jgi:hypothetical protein
MYSGRVVPKVRSAALMACLLGLPGVSHAAGTPREAAECASAYVAAQQMRIGGKLLASRRQLLVCARDACAPSLRLDCLRWLSEVDAATPTVVFAAQGPDGQDLTAVKVAVDGERLADHLGGGAVPVDLGPHKLHFEADGYASVDTSVVLREGEKAREIRVTFTRAPATAPLPPRAMDGVTETTSARPIVAYVLGGTGLAATAVGAVFEITGLAHRRDLFSCAPPGCSQAQFDATRQSAERAFVAGDILVGVGLACLATAAIVYLAKRPAGPQREAHQLGLLPVAGGAVGEIGGRF